MKKYIVHIGSSLNDKGGITTVINGIMDSKLNKTFRFKHITTYSTKGKIQKILLFLIGYTKILFNLMFMKIRIAHIHMSYKGSFYRKAEIIKLCRLFKVPIVLHIHGSCTKEFYEGLNDRKKKYYSNIINKCNKVIVLSNSWKKFFSQIIDVDKIVVIYNNVNIPKEIKRKGNKNQNQILFLGRLGKRKGVYDIISASEILKKEGLQFRIILAGDGEIETIRKLIAEKGLENNIETVGWIGDKEKKKLLEESDIFILPSYNEGLPMSVLEAMSYKLPVITTKVGGIPEVIENGKTGYIINPGDIDELVGYIKILMNDYELRQRVAQEAYEFVLNNCNSEKELTKMSDLYNALLTSNMKVCLISSAGGHLMQLKQLFNMIKKYNYYIVTEKNLVSIDLKENHKVYYLRQQERRKYDFIFKFISNILKSIYIVIKERPKIVVSTGAGVTYITCLLVKMLGGRVIFIESFAKTKSPTMTGKLTYKFADEFYVQWPEMLKIYPKAKYKGGIY